jgi:alkylation response protein AidB-like acyl-CoA dehydrogenase
MSAVTLTQVSDEGDLLDGLPGARELLGLCRELAAELRSLALAVDSDPFGRARLQDSAALDELRRIATPAPYRDAPVPWFAESFTTTCLGRVAANIELARGDAGVVSACPAPSLAGLTVDALGDEPQREQFYRDQAGQRWWTFFGMTEPAHGSDAAALETRLTRGGDGGYRLSGEKRYVANAARGQIGVVWARTGPSLLNVRAVVLRPPAPGLTTGNLDMLGLRGACIGQLRLDDVPVSADQVLGARLPLSRRGLWGANRAFAVVRLQIASQALGLAFAVTDAVRAARPGADGSELIAARLAAARDLLLSTAVAVDADPDGRTAPALAKLHAVNLAVEVTRWAEQVLPPGALLEQPLLEKWCRDAYAFEFMDGTSNILRLTAAPAPPRTPLKEES